VSDQTGKRVDQYCIAVHTIVYIFYGIKKVNKAIKTCTRLL